MLNYIASLSLFSASDWLIFWSWGLFGGFEPWLQTRPTVGIGTNVHGAWPGGQSICLHLQSLGKRWVLNVLDHFWFKFRYFICLFVYFFFWSVFVAVYHFFGYGAGGNGRSEGSVRLFFGQSSRSEWWWFHGCAYWSPFRGGWTGQHIHLQWRSISNKSHIFTGAMAGKRVNKKKDILTVKPAVLLFAQIG